MEYLRVSRNNQISLTVLSSFGVKRYGSTKNRNGTNRIKINGTANGIGDGIDFTTHNNIKQRIWIVVNKCILWVRT